MLSSLISSPADRLSSRGFGTAATPELPKRPGSAFTFFVKAESQKGGTAAQQMKSLASKWKTMSEADKTPFVSQQTRALDEYNRTISRIDPQVLKSLNEAKL